MLLEMKGATDRISCHFGPFFALSPPENPKNHIFEKLKKASEDNIILHMCTINDYHFLSFWIAFCPFTPLPLMDSKNQNFERMNPLTTPKIKF